MNSISHIELIDIVIERVEISPAHKSRTSCICIIEFIRDKSHTREVVVAALDLCCIIRITEDKTVFVSAERAVGNCTVVGIIAAGEEFILVYLLCLRSIAVVTVTGKCNVVDPEVFTGTEIAYDRVVVVRLGIVLHIKVFYDDIVACR